MRKEISHDGATRLWHGSVSYPLYDIQFHDEIDEEPVERLPKRVYQATLAASICFYTVVLFTYVPLNVGIVKSKEVVVAGYLLALVLFSPQVLLTVEELIDLWRIYRRISRRLAH